MSWSDEADTIALMRTPQPDGRPRLMWNHGAEEPTDFDGQMFCRHGANVWCHEGRWISTCFHSQKLGAWRKVLHACGPLAECEDEAAADALPVKAEDGDEPLSTAELNKALREAEDLCSHIGKSGYDGSPVMALVRHVRAREASR